MTSNVFSESKMYLIEGNEALVSSLNKTGFPYSIALVGEHNKTVEFYRSKKDRFKSGSTLYIEDSPAFRGNNYETISREMTTIDNIVKQQGLLGQIEFLKLDIQGAELPALRGALETIQSSVEFILCEASILQYNIGAPSIFQLHAFFESIDFVMYDIADLRYLGNVGLKLDRDSITTNEEGYYGKHLLQLDILWVKRTSKFFQKTATLYDPIPAASNSLPMTTTTAAATTDCGTLGEKIITMNKQKGGGGGGRHHSSHNNINHHILRHHHDDNNNGKDKTSSVG